MKNRGSTYRKTAIKGWEQNMLGEDNKSSMDHLGQDLSNKFASFDSSELGVKEWIGADFVFFSGWRCA